MGGSLSSEFLHKTRQKSTLIRGTARQRHRLKKNMLIYVICHDDASERVAHDMCCRYTSPPVPRAPGTSADDEKNIEAGTAEPPFFPTVRAIPIKTDSSGPLFESAAFECVDERRHVDGWENEDFVGFVTYSFENKLRIHFSDVYDDGRAFRPWTWRDWSETSIDATERALDVVGLVEIRYFRKQNHGASLTSRMSMLRTAQQDHGDVFLRAWKALTEPWFSQSADASRASPTDPGAAVIESSDVDHERSTRQPFFPSNWWFCKPALLDAFLREAYLPALRKAFGDPTERDHDTTETATARDLLYQDSRYQGGLKEEQLIARFGVPYYPMHPFVFERLPSAFFAASGARIGFPSCSKPQHRHYYY